MYLRHCVAPSPLCLVCVSEYVLFRVAFVAGVVFDVIKEFAAAGGGLFFRSPHNGPRLRAGAFLSVEQCKLRVGQSRHLPVAEWDLRTQLGFLL